MPRATPRPRARSSVGISENRILVERACLRGEPAGRIAAFVEHDNHVRPRESLGNLTPADVRLGRGEDILRERARIKRQTLIDRRSRHHAQAACPPPQMDQSRRS